MGRLRLPLATREPALVGLQPGPLWPFSCQPYLAHGKEPPREDRNTGETRLESRALPCFGWARGETVEEGGGEREAGACPPRQSGVPQLLCVGYIPTSRGAIPPPQPRRHLECSDAHPLALASRNAAYPGPEMGSNCVWQIHASFICSGDTQQIALSPWKNTNPEKGSKESTAFAKRAPRPGEKSWWFWKDGKVSEK